MIRRETTASAGADVCSHCNSDDRWILHHVHHRHTYRRLCTTCVLKLNITAFCPICFALHHRPAIPPATLAVSPATPPLRGTLICFKCSSNSHSTCVPPNAPKSPYLCPTCTNPSSKLFDFKNPSQAGFKQVIDQKSSKVFLAAAMIAANSINEAVDRARAEAERKAKESVVARKKAKDALEQVALVWARDQERIRMGEGTSDANQVSIRNNGNGSSAVVNLEKNGGIGGKEVEKAGSGKQIMAGLNVMVDKIRIEKEGVSNGGQGDKSNGMASGSQPLQKVTNLDNLGGKVN